jgi:hypothetical protein
MNSIPAPVKIFILLFRRAIVVGFVFALLPMLR